MFCQICGVEAPDRSNFCWKCGACVKNEKDGEDKKKIVSFTEFRKRKEVERSSRFQPKKKLKSGSSSTSKTKGKEDAQVSINVNDYINNNLFEIGESLEAESSDNNHCGEDDSDRIIEDAVTKEQHADRCVDIWIGEVQVEDSENESEIDTDLPDPGLYVELSDTSSLKNVAQQLADIHVKKEQPRKVNVRRKHLWIDFKEAKKKWNLTANTPIRVVFLGEPAVDDGGPKREFFSELLEYIEVKLFADGKPINSIIGLQNEDFKLAGEVMVMSILQGGPAPAFLHRAIFNVMTNQQLSIEDIPESIYKRAANQIMEAKCDEELHNVLVSDDVLTVLGNIGYTGVPHRETLKSITGILQSICIKSQFISTMPELMQLEQGLSSCGILESVKKCPELWKFAFVRGSSNLKSPDEFLDELEVKYSQSQLQKDKEIDVFKYFCEFIQSLEFDEEISIAGLLKWMSGTKTTPVLGFSKKKTLVFVHGCKEGCRCRPTVSTCDLLLMVPVHITNEEDMKIMMTSALKESCGFGFI
ncbi:uncharacterized protein LOC114518737 [Dendronephthya gigantea]|uniref:uncharacterized protein LOC114518737 n=1 Tax=Dendronephthya gigantea TaxID=151771 RepID=UPI001069E005|nr:uncharacterized protein LOC114518737 [Dendronephthya gigantea]